MRLRTATLPCVLAISALIGCASAPHHTATTETARPVAKYPASLTTHHWTLAQAYTADGKADTSWHIPARTTQTPRPVQLDFSKDHIVSVQRLCNQMNGRYEIKGSNITITRLMSTLMACQDAQLGALEQKVGALLPQAQSWGIDNTSEPRLEIRFSDGQRWQLQGTPTNETLYGIGERIFWEVAPQTVSCQHPLIANAQCLQVREVRYSNQGIKQSADDWTLFFDHIQGYTHQAGVRNILRLNRFQRPHSAAAVSPYLYVLDMTVETEVVR